MVSVISLRLSCIMLCLSDVSGSAHMVCASNSIFVGVMGGVHLVKGTKEERILLEMG